MATHFTTSCAQHQINCTVGDYKDMGQVNANYNAMHSPSLACKNKTENDSIIGCSNGRNFCQGKEADIALFLQVANIRKISRNI